MPRFQHERVQELAPGTVAVLGVPDDHGSTYMRGPAGAPTAIRAQLHSGSANLCTEAGLDLGAQTAFVDLGDLQPGHGEAARREIERCVSDLLERGCRVLSIGGDHAVTAPLVAAHAKTHRGIEILHFDAHPDLYDEYDGDRYANACPFARIMEAGHARRLVQVGIRTMNPHQRAQAERFGRAACLHLMNERDADALAALAATAEPVVAARTAPQVDLARDVTLLRSEDFVVRARASERLVAAGASALLTKPYSLR